MVEKQHTYPNVVVGYTDSDTGLFVEGEKSGNSGLTDQELRASPVNTKDKNGTGNVVYITNTSPVSSLQATYVMCLTDTVFSTFVRTNSVGSIAGVNLPAGTLLVGPVTSITLTSGAVAAYE
jgi:hypothetical protein